MSKRIPGSGGEQWLHQQRGAGYWMRQDQVPSNTSATAGRVLGDDHPGADPTRCRMCKRLLDVPGDELSRDCGGDCWGCLGPIEAEMGDEESRAKVIDECKRGVRPKWPNEVIFRVEGTETGRFPADKPNQ